MGGGGLEVKLLDDSPPCYRLRGRLSQTEISHFGSSLHLENTKTKAVRFSPINYDEIVQVLYWGRAQETEDNQRPI